MLKGTDRTITLTDIIRRHAGARPHPLDMTAEVQMPRAFPSGVHVAEVEIDPGTGSTSVLAYVAVDDIGRVLKKVLAEGQVRAASCRAQDRCSASVASTTRWAAADQQLHGLHHSRAEFMPGVRIVDAPVTSPNNQLGAKGVRELGTVGTAPALMNAALAALRLEGVTAFDPKSGSGVGSAESEAKGVVDRWKRFIKGQMAGLCRA